MTSRPADILVVGAGTTGLALALQAHDHGARVRIVERRPEAFRPSRAMIMHPRTLELLRPLGVTDALLAHGDVAASARLHLRSRVVAVRIDQLDLAGTAFPHLLLIRQADVEAVLARALEDRGVSVERGTEFVRDVRTAGRRRAIVRRGEDTEAIPFRFLVGCDGAASTVRSRVGAWRGGDYAQEVVLADLELGAATAGAGRVGAGLEPGTAHVVAGRHGLVFLFAIGERATWRMLATRRAGGPPPSARSAVPGQPGPSVPRAELQQLIDESGLAARVTEVAWSAQVSLQYRLATHFGRGPVFIAGDAAHVHSPAAGQGMNTGIQDALNLGWKLAFTAVAARESPPREGPGHESPAREGPGHAAEVRPVAALLRSYEAERRPADRHVLRLTHAIFWAEASLHPLAQFVRAVIVPLGAPLVPWLTRRRRLVEEGARTLSQFRLSYRHSPLSVEGTPPGTGPRPGSRLPDARIRCDGERMSLHALLAVPGVHVLLQADADEPDRSRLDPRVHVHRLADRPGRGLLVVRPDGYVGFRSALLDQDQLGQWLGLIGLPERASASASDA